MANQVVTAGDTKKEDLTPRLEDEETILVNALKLNEKKRQRRTFPDDAVVSFPPFD